MAGAWLRGPKALYAKRRKHRIQNVGSREFLGRRISIRRVHRCVSLTVCSVEVLWSNLVTRNGR